MGSGYFKPSFCYPSEYRTENYSLDMDIYSYLYWQATSDYDS